MAVFSDNDNCCVKHVFIWFQLIYLKYEYLFLKKLCWLLHLPQDGSADSKILFNDYSQHRDHSVLLCWYQKIICKLYWLTKCFQLVNVIKIINSNLKLDFIHVSHLQPAYSYLFSLYIPKLILTRMWPCHTG